MAAFHFLLFSLLFLEFLMFYSIFVLSLRSVHFDVTGDSKF